MTFPHHVLHLSPLLSTLYDYILVLTECLLCFCPEFPTSRMEMEAVADKFDKDGDGYIDYKEFVSALRPDRDVSVTGHNEHY